MPSDAPIVNSVNPANPDSRAIRRFRTVSLATVLTIYVLILVGGIVRASGSGMGCPDWPTCFGRWIPPTAEAQLPADYQSIYADRGYRDTTFNVRKTWIEYLNRLLGVFTGLWIFATLLCAVPLRRQDGRLLTMSFAGFLLVGFQGWLGSRVVASNLAPGMITLHMLLAQIIVCLLIYVYLRSNRQRLMEQSLAEPAKLTRIILWVAIAVTLLQLLSGTQVREAVDIVAKANNNENRQLWIDNLPLIFSLHRILAYPAALLNIAAVIIILQSRGLAASAHRVAAIVLFLTIAAMVMGLSLDRLHVPAFAQPLHLWFASMILGGLFYLVFVLYYARKQHESQPAPSVPTTAAGPLINS